MAGIIAKLFIKLVYLLCGYNKYVNFSIKLSEYYSKMP